MMSPKREFKLTTKEYYDIYAILLGAKERGVGSEHTHIESLMRDFKEIIERENTRLQDPNIV